MIRNIVFDMGQVLIVYDPERFVRQLGYTDQNEIDYIVKHIYLSTIWRDMDAGLIDAKKGHQLLIDTIEEKYRKDADILVNKWWYLKDPIDGMLELVEELSNKGYKLYLLSNASNDHPVYWQKLPYKQFFNGLYVSSLHKKTKPNRDIYEDFVNEFNLNKQECLFIDDTKANVDAANEFGIRSHVFVNTKELTDYLKSLNII